MDIQELCTIFTTFLHLKYSKIEFIDLKNACSAPIMWMWLCAGFSGYFVCCTPTKVRFLTDWPQLSFLESVVPSTRGYTYVGERVLTSQTDWSSAISNLHKSISGDHFHTLFSSCLIVVFQLLFKSDYKLWGYKSHSITRTLTGHMPPSTMEDDLCEATPHLRAWSPLWHVNIALKGAVFWTREQAGKPKCCRF